MTSALASLSSLSPAELALIPAGIPPAGQESNLVNPKSNGYLFLIVGSVVMGIMYLAVGLSFYVKVMIRRCVSLDDWSRLIGTIGATLYFIICIFAVITAKFGTHMWDLSVGHVLSDPFIITGYFSNWVTALVWPFAKSSFFIIYLDMFGTILWQRYAIYFGLFVTWGFYLAILIVTLYYCSPVPGQSWQASFVSSRYNDSLKLSIPVASGSLIIDLYILFLPMVPIWRLQMNMKKKLGVTAVFATGLIACVASSLSIYFKTLLNSHESDFSYYSLKVLIMAIVEMCVGITASSMPSMAFFFRYHGSPFARLFSRLIRFSQNLFFPRSATPVDLSEANSDRWPLKELPHAKDRYNRAKEEEEGSDGGASEHPAQIPFVPAHTGAFRSAPARLKGMHIQYALSQQHEHTHPERHVVLDTGTRFS